VECLYGADHLREVEARHRFLERVQAGQQRPQVPARQVLLHLLSEKNKQRVYDLEINRKIDKGR
jgi:hypothetical protein